MPSPRHLIIQGKKEQALKNLNIIARFNCKPKLHVRLVTDQEKKKLTMKRNSQSRSPSPQQTSKPEIEGNGKDEDFSESEQRSTGRQSSINVAFHESRPLIPKRRKVNGMLCFHSYFSLSTTVAVFVMFVRT